MLLCSYTGQGLEPVSVMGGPVADSPILHSVCHNVCDGRIQLRTVFYCLFQLFKNAFRQVLPHNGFIKHIFTKNLSYIYQLTHNPSILLT